MWARILRWLLSAKCEMCGKRVTQRYLVLDLDRPNSFVPDTLACKECADEAYR